MQLEGRQIVGITLLCFGLKKIYFVMLKCLAQNYNQVRSNDELFVCYF